MSSIQLVIKTQFDLINSDTETGWFITSGDTVLNTAVTHSQLSWRTATLGHLLYCL